MSVFHVGDDFVFGINYWPRMKAMRWWKEFDHLEVEEEFSIISDIGIDIVRIFLLWEDFQPTPDSINSISLSNLKTVADIAENKSLKLNITFFTGHMSGPNWIPSWMLNNTKIPAPYINQVISDNKIKSKNDGGYRNMYEDKLVINAALLLVENVVRLLSNHSAVWCWNLGNEPDLVISPVDENNVNQWVLLMRDTIKKFDQLNRPIIFGLHIISLARRNGFRVDKISEILDFSVMHAYPMYTSWADGPLDPNLVPYTCVLSSILSGKPTLMEEWGGCTISYPSNIPELSSTSTHNLGQYWKWDSFGESRNQFMATENDFCEYVKQVILNLMQVGAIGAFLWCFSDYHTSIWDKPPCNESVHERFFGLLRFDGTLKPHAEWLKTFISSVKLNKKIKTPFTFNLNMTAESYYENPGENCEAMYKVYLSSLEKNQT